jgi:hypothetical protein
VKITNSDKVSSYDYAYSVVTDVAGNSYMTGKFSVSITFDVNHTFASNGSSDIFLVKYDASGNGQDTSVVQPLYSAQLL